MTSMGKLQWSYDQHGKTTMALVAPCSTTRPGFGPVLTRNDPNPPNPHMPAGCCPTTLNPTPAALVP